MFEDIKKVLIDAINVDEEEIKPEAKLNDDLGIDSLAAVELALELENEFDIRIEDEELAKLEIRKHYYKNYKIFYFVEEEERTVYILRVLHMLVDSKALLLHIVRDR